MTRFGFVERFSSRRSDGKNRQRGHWTNLLGRRVARKRVGSPANVGAPAVEVLEQRTLLAASFIAGALTAPAANTVDVIPSITNCCPVEPAISVNPTDPGNLILSSQNGERVTTNSSGSFSELTTFPIGASFVDTTTAFDGQGRLFWSNLDGSTNGVDVVRLNPATGAVAAGPFAVSTPSAGNCDDKQVMAADRSNNNLYLVWTRFLAPNCGNGGTQVLLSRSANQGQNWSATPVAVSESGEGFVWPATVGVAPDGTVYVAYHSQPGFTDGVPDGTSGKTFVARYTNDLASQISKTLAFAAGESDITFNVQDLATRKIPNTQFWTQGSAQPWVLPDPARPGNVYVVAADDPNNGGAGDPANVVFSRSTDNGVNWTKSTIDAGPSNSFQLFPTAAIDRFGNIAVAWYDNRRGLTNASGRFLLDVFARYSTDGGQMWSAAFQVNDPAIPFDPDAGAVDRFPGPPPTKRIGEYFGIDLYGGTAYLAWNGNTFSGSTPIGQQVYHDAFPINGSLMVTGDDSGTTNDTITLQPVSGRSGFIEVLVNGVRQYAGLASALAGGITIDGLGGSDTVNLTGSLTLFGSLSVIAETVSIPGSVSTATNSQPITIAADNLNLASGSLNSGSSTVTLRQNSNGTAINLGGADAVATLGLTDVELDKITAATINIGNTNSGTVTVSSSISHSGDSHFKIVTGRNVIFNSGISWITTNGNFVMEANQQATPATGNFAGVNVNGGVIRTTGTGSITVKGKGGSDANTSTHVGVFVQAGGVVESTSSAAGAGTITVIGTGGTGAGINYGVRVFGANSRVSSVVGNIEITGTGAACCQSYNGGILVLCHS